MVVPEVSVGAKTIPFFQSHVCDSCRHQIIEVVKSSNSEDLIKVPTVRDPRVEEGSVCEQLLLLMNEANEINGLRASCQLLSEWFRSEWIESGHLQKIEQTEESQHPNVMSYLQSYWDGDWSFWKAEVVYSDHHFAKWGLNLPQDVVLFEGTGLDFEPLESEMLEVGVTVRRTRITSTSWNPQVALKYLPMLSVGIFYIHRITDPSVLAFPRPLFREIQGTSSVTCPHEESEITLSPGLSITSLRVIKDLDLVGGFGDDRSSLRVHIVFTEIRGRSSEK